MVLLGGPSIFLCAVERSTVMMSTRASVLCILPTQCPASSQPNATRLEGGAQMTLLLGPSLPPFLPTLNCHPISTMPYLYPVLHHLHTYFGLEDTETERKITFALKERQPTAINRKDWESGTIGGQRYIPSRGDIRAKS